MPIAVRTAYRSTPSRQESGPRGDDGDSCAIGRCEDLVCGAVATLGRRVVASAVAGVPVGWLNPVHGF